MLPGLRDRAVHGDGAASRAGRGLARGGLGEQRGAPGRGVGEPLGCAQRRGEVGEAARPLERDEQSASRCFTPWNAPIGWPN